MFTAPTDLHDRFFVEGRDVLKVTCRRCMWQATVTKKGLVGALLHECLEAA